MDYIKEAENYLYHYRDMKRAVKNSKREIEKIKNRTAPGPLNAVQMDITGVRGSKEGNTLDDMFKLKMWFFVYRENLTEVKRIAKLLQDISDEEKQPFKEVLEYWYVERKNCAEICELMEIKKTEAYQQKKAALQKFATALFGIKLVKVI